jgi:antirestriction protein
MPKLYANPYDISASGFYFKSPEEYEKLWQEAYDKRGTEEYEIDFIDGDAMETALWYAGPTGSPGDLEDYFDLLAAREDDQIRFLLYAEQYSPSSYDLGEVPEDFNYSPGTLEDYAYELVNDAGVGNDSYFDYEAFGRDLAISGDMTNDLDEDDPDDAEQIAFYEDMSDRELGEHVVYEVFGGVDELGKRTREMYFDYEAFARDLGYDGYHEVYLNGEPYTIMPF